MPTVVVRDPRALGIPRPTSLFCVPKDAHAMQAVGDALGLELDYGKPEPDPRSTRHAPTRLKPWVD